MHCANIGANLDSKMVFQMFHKKVCQKGETEEERFIVLDVDLDSIACRDFYLSCYR